MKSYADNLRLLRISKNLSQQYLADRLDMSQTTYARLESGKIKLSMQRLEEIAGVFEISLESLLNPRKSVLDESVLNLTNEFILKLRSEKEELLRQRVAKLEDEVNYLRKLLLKLADNNESKSEEN